MSVPCSSRDADLTQLSSLLDDVFRRSRGVHDQDMFTDFPLVFAPANLRNCRVIIEDGVVVSHAALWERELVVEGTVLKVGEIIAVVTHPDYRLRGYADARPANNNARRGLYDMGILWTGVPDFYRKLGWEAVAPRG